MRVNIPDKQWPIYRKIARCSVQVTTKDRWLGTGVIISQDGLVITALHVVRNAQNIRLRRIFLNQKRQQMTVGSARCLADIVFMDAMADLAVLQMRNLPKKLRPAKIGNSDIEPHTGLYRLGMGDCPIGSGYLFDRNTYYGVEEMCIGLPCQQGNSGGGIFDACGRLIGIVLRTRYDQLVPNACYAIPVNTIRQRFQERIDDEIRHLLSRFLA